MSIGMAAIILGGKVTVSTAGTRVQLTTSVAHQNLHNIKISADEDNAGKVYVGDVTVTSDKYLDVLLAGDSVEIPSPAHGGGAVLGNLDATSIYLDSDIASQSVQWGFN